MPNGYTAAIKDGISFEQFAMNCARAFGALIMMRDEPSSAAIPERFEPSDYHLKAIIAARNVLGELECLSPWECFSRVDTVYLAAERQRLERLDENKNLLAAYRDMLDSVRTWIAPSKEHESLKEFMAKQLKDSIKFDDHTDYYEKPIVRLSAQDWLDEQKAKALKDIAYHKAERAKEIERTDQSNTWLRLLRESLAVQS